MLLAQSGGNSHPVLPTLNLTSFAESGAPPTDHIPKHWSFVASK